VWNISWPLKKRSLPKDPSGDQGGGTDTVVIADDSPDALCWPK